MESNVTDDGGFEEGGGGVVVGGGAGGGMFVPLPSYGGSPAVDATTPPEARYDYDVRDGYDDDGGLGDGGGDEGLGEGDDSSAGDYADRNSDPGIDGHAEAEYALPVGGKDMGVSGGAGGGGGLSFPIPHHGLTVGGGGGAMNSANESVSLGTATQTHEVRMPMLLSTFKPATGCTNASDFVVRCFVARLRSGITVVKHGRNRWCKSRLRVLHVHSDGSSLSWKPALGEPSSGKRPPKLDLTTCVEVRHAWSPDPDNPMFTGTPILRQKCEAANAHKSFALIFPRRTVDITAVTADQCKVLMEGFSALCFRLQVAQNVANSGNQQQTSTSGGGTTTGVEGGGGVGGKGLGGYNDTAGTLSVTMTNTSTRQQESHKGRRR